MLRNKAAQVLKAGRRDAAARGGDVAPIFTALAESYKRQARLSEQSRELLATSDGRASSTAARTEPETT
jgi:hypothetical protein